MIVDLQKFIAQERVQWERLDVLLTAIGRDPWREIPLEEARELERLYQRAAADLARLSTYAAEPQTRKYLEHLVARGHAEIHGSADRNRERFALLPWLGTTIPQTFRRRIRSFWFAALLTLVGCIFGAMAIVFDADAKDVLMPFEHLRQSPAERVAHEREDAGRSISERNASFSGMLMTHNTQVALTVMALGMLWGVGTVVLLFYNGVILGAVAADYILGGQTTFLLGWLLPHGAVEIPAILVGGQAGFVLASAMLGRGQRLTLAGRLRAVVPDVVTLCMTAALMLVWAGMVEAFLSQYHEPVVPYTAKIAFGLSEMAFLIWYAGWAGRGRPTNSGLTA